MARGLDHIVHAVRDLDAAAALYGRLGFKAGARNRHAPAWGTQNHVVQLRGCFIELLGIADATHIAPHAPDHFSFGAHNRDFLVRGQGLSMLVLEGHDTAAEAAAFRTAGIGDFKTFDFERNAKRPDGSPVKVAFSLAFARDPNAPDIGFFTCRQHYPENFWNPAFQVHGNTATGIAGVVLVAEKPADHHVFLSAFTGEREMLATSAGITLKTPRGDIAVMNSTAFTDHFGVPPPDIARSARLAAVRFAVRDRDQAAAELARGEVAFSMQRAGLVVGPQAALGATLVFETA